MGTSRSGAEPKVVSFFKRWDGCQIDEDLDVEDTIVCRYVSIMIPTINY